MLLLQRFSNPIYCQYLFLVFALFTAFCLQLNLFIRCLKLRRRDGQLSPSILLNIGVWVVACAEGAVYIAFLLLYFDTQKDAFLMFCLGTGLVSLAIAVSASVTFLLLDRIYALVFPLHYKNHHGLFVIFSVLFCLLCAVANFSVIGAFNFPLPRYTACFSILCLATQKSGVFGGSVKLTIGLLNLFASVLFKFLLNAQANRILTERQFRRANFLVWTAFISELIFVFAPQLLIILSALLQVPVWQQLGSYGFLMFSLEALSTSIIYRLIMNSRLLNKSSAIGTLASMSHANIVVY